MDKHIFYFSRSLKKIIFYFFVALHPPSVLVKFCLEQCIPRVFLRFLHPDLFILDFLNLQVNRHNDLFYTSLDNLGYRELCLGLHTKEQGQHDD